MSETKITSEVCLVSEVLCSGCFTVPWHQRYYDWKVEQVGELLTDLHDAVEGDKACYFVGSIMLVSSSLATSLRVNDGQQRLITLSLLIAALCRRFEKMLPPDNARETRGLRALFDEPDYHILKLSEAAKYKPRIEPPRRNKSTYQQLIRGHDIGTNGALTSAWEVIDLFVGAMDRRAIESFSDFVMQKVEVSVLQVPSDVDANSVFESLNARGKPLDDVDLIRNRLYSYFSDQEDPNRRETIHERLESPAVVLGPSNVQDYFRCYLQCRYGYLQKNRFYREVRQKIEGAAEQDDPPSYVYNLIDGLGKKESMQLFRTLTSSRPDVALNINLPKISGYRDITVLLSELKDYKVTQPLVFSLLHRFLEEKDKDIKRKVGLVVARSLKNLTSFVMRTTFVASKFEPSKFEAAFSNFAMDVFRGTDFQSLDIYEGLAGTDEYEVIDNVRFIRRMTDMEIRTNAKALRFLFGINSKHQLGSDVFRRDHCTVEHVLPQSDQHWSDWKAFSEEQAKECIYRTGNMVILTKRENRSNEEFNKSFLAKADFYKDSALSMPRLVAENHDEWTPGIVEKRSKALAKEAASVWQFSPSKA